MAFNIPEKSFLSFGRKQSLDSLWRIGKQIHQHWDKKDKRSDSLRSLEKYLTILNQHEDLYVKEQAKKLKEIFPEDEREMQNFLMHLERELEVDLKDSDFLITFEDKVHRTPKETRFHLVLDNLRSAFNVGSLFRTAEALSYTEIHICGYTPTPESSKVAKAALGTENWVKWHYWDNGLECIEWLKQNNITTYGFETEASATNLSELKPIGAAAIILGNERYGLSEVTLKKCDQFVKIPLDGKKNSLNVGICGAIALHQLILSQR